MATTSNKKIFLVSHFGMGLSDSQKEGPAGSFDWARAIDIFTEPTTIQLLPKTAKISSTTVVDLIKWMVRAGDGNVYGYDASGNIYKNASGTVTKLRTVSTSSGNGLAYFSENDTLYYARNSTIGSYGPLANSPAFNDDPFSNGTYDKDQYASVTGQTYTVPAALSEAATDLQAFTPTQDPVKSIEVSIGAKGTGDWTLTLHDELNNVIATKTIANASLAASGAQKFTFATVARVSLGQDYHFHLVSTVADGTVVTATASDFNTCVFADYFQVLLTNTDFHPIIDFYETIIFGNEDYIGVWDGYSYPINSCAIKLPRGYKARCLAKIGEYVAIGCWRGSITGDEQGMIVFWDGVAMDFNYSIDVPEGPVHALYTNQNRLFFVAGSEADLFVVVDDSIQKVHGFPKRSNQTYVEVAPGAMGSWQAMLIEGAAYNSDSTVIEKGVYVYGQRNKNYTEAFIYGFPISSGTRTGTTLKIGSVLGQGQTLHIGWRDNTTYGWDTVNNSSAPFATGVIDPLIFDNSTPFKQKLAEVIRVDHKALAANESVQIGYKIDRASSWTTATANSTVGSTETRLPINKRFKEIQIEITLGATSTSPTVTSIALSFDNLDTEDAV